MIQNFFQLCTIKLIKSLHDNDLCVCLFVVNQFLFYIFILSIFHFVGTFALWMIPQIFAYALNFPIQKFLQAQRKVLVMLWISLGVLVLHVPLSWLLILKLNWGLVGAAIILNTSWWLIVIGQLLYIFITKSDGAWSGFSWLAFADLFNFLKLSLASAVMLWYIFIFSIRLN